MHFRFRLRFPTLKEVVVALIFVSFLIIDTEHDWKARVSPLLRMSEWMGILLKLSIVAVAVYRSYAMTYGEAKSTMPLSMRFVN